MKNKQTNEIKNNCYLVTITGLMNSDGWKSNVQILLIAYKITLVSENKK